MIDGGTRTSDVVQGEPVASQGSGLVENDLSCVQCSYSLRTLAADANSPECGAPVLRSLSADLSLADAAWLRALTSGAGWMTFGVLSALVLFLGGFFLFASDRGGLDKLLGISVGEMAESLFVMAPVVGAAMLAWGIFQFTTPEDLRTGCANWPRQWSRWTGLVSMGAVVGACLLFCAAEPMAASVMLIVLSPIGVVGVALMFSLAPYEWRLLERCALQQKAQSVRGMGWAFGALWVLWLGLPTAASLASIRNADLTRILLLFASLAMLVLQVCVLAVAPMLLRTRIRRLLRERS